MQQLIENLKNGKVWLVETPMPSCGSNEVLVRNVTSLISPGTEKLMIEMGQKNLIGKAMARPDLASMAFQKAKREGFLNVFREAMDRLDEPLPLGYSSAGEVVEVGRDVKGFLAGDRVACAGSGFASHAEIIAVPEGLCVKLPTKKSGSEALSYEEAAFVMLGGIALQGFRCAELTFGERVVVVGLGLIGLLLVQIGKAYGCTVIGVDIDPEKVKLASALGCDSGLVVGRDSVEQAVLNLTAGHGADAVILAAATKDNAPILLAEQITRKRGRIVLVGVSDLSLTRKAFWDKELIFTVSKASGPTVGGKGSHVLLPVELVRWTELRNLQEVIRLLSNGSVKVKELITHRFSIKDATLAYDMILKGSERYIGVVITYAGDSPAERIVKLPKGRASSVHSATSDTRSSLGVIGAGMFTKNVLLPTARKVPGLRFIGIAAKTGVSSQHVGKKFGFEYATTDPRAILDDKRIGSVLITTRHNLHADLVVEALAAGKNVFVEKPLCITREQLSRITDAHASSEGSSLVMVGFNRRYSPLGIRLRDCFAGRTCPMQIHYRVNAGYIPPDHWTQDTSIGGGRIIGEVCHFIDLLQFITSEVPVEVFASSIGGNTGRFAVEDNVELCVRFSGGSLGTITYTALGTKTFSRERVEVYCDESVAVLEDFRRLEFVKGAKKKNTKLWSQDVGYFNELEHFLKASPSDSEKMLHDAVFTTLATFAAVRSLRTRKGVVVSDPEVTS
jgi:predicted dehydrogenase/threonine dehydrogenase-like Zn-dependent dehydrogenase